MFDCKGEIIIIEEEKNHCVLIVHGLGSSKKIIEEKQIYWELKKKSKVYSAEYLEGPDNAYGDIKEYAGTLDENIKKIRREANADKIDIIAHSMGGLISRYRIQKIQDNDIGKLIMIGTPNHGTIISNNIFFNIWQISANPKYGFSILFKKKHIKGDPNQAINQMLPGSDFLFELNGNRATDVEIAKGNVTDTISDKVPYFVIGGDSKRTFGSSKREIVKGDRLVPFDSARLSNVPIYSVPGVHSGQLNNPEIIDIVERLLYPAGL